MGLQVKGTATERLPSVLACWGHPREPCTPQHCPGTANHEEEAVMPPTPTTSEGPHSPLRRQSSGGCS